MEEVLLVNNPQRTTQSLHVNFFFCHFVHSIVSHVQLDRPKLDNIQLEAVRPYSTKPGTQELSLMALTLYFLTQTLYTKYKIEERPPLE